MAKIPGVNVIAPVVPFDTADVHPSHEARYGKGGYRTVATLADRDAIPAPRREAGMLVFVTADQNIYTLGADLTTWELLELGGGQPDAHAATHAAAGSDPLTLTVAQVTGLQSALDAKATPADVTSAVAAVVNAAPATLDTLNELAAALGNDASFATTVTNALAAKAPINSPTFTGTVSGVTKAMVGLGNVDNTSDSSKPVSTAQAAADAAVASAAAADATTKANAAQAAAVQRANHTGTQTASTISDFSSAASAAAPVQSVAGKTGTVTLVKGDVGLGSVDNTSDASKPISTATQAALDGKAAALHTHSVGDITGFSAAAASAAPVQSVNGQTGAVTVATYSLPVATASVLGGVKAGANVTIDGTGVISVAAPVTSLPYSSITGTPTLATVATSGSAADLTGTLSAARLPTVLERTVTVGNSGTSTTLSLANGSVQTVTLNGNCTFTMPAASAGASLTLILTQSGTFTATFTGVLWSGGTAPTITATANKRDIIVFVSDGTNWYGTASQNF